MNEYNGRLYIGTWNMATDFRRVADADAYLRPHYGFDLFETTDGWHFTPVTTNGFGDIYSNGVRSFASTPHGLFVGTANKWQGLRVWRELNEPTHLSLTSLHMRRYAWRLKPLTIGWFFRGMTQPQRAAIGSIGHR